MIYYFDPAISYKTFKKVMDKFPDSGPTPANIDKILWQMLRDRKINIAIDTKAVDDPVVFTLKRIPSKATLLRNK